MRHRLSIGIVLAAFFARDVHAADSVAAAKETPANLDEQVARRIFVLSGEARSGLPELAWDEGLAAVAREYSRRMAAEGLVRHEDAEGRTPQDRVSWGHRTWAGPVSENLWMLRARRPDPELLAQDAVDSWMKSPGHRRNLLAGDRTHMGVGVHAAGDRVFAAQILARREAQLAHPLPLCVEGTAPLDLTIAAGRAEFVDRVPEHGGPPSLRQRISPQLIWPSATAGTFRLRFWIPSGGRSWRIVPGPSLIWSTGGCSGMEKGSEVP